MGEGEIIKDGPWAGFEVLSVYTRAQAIDDGVLVDLTEWARETGFKVPVACTAAVWDVIEPNVAEQALGQDARGRGHDVLWLAWLAIKRKRHDEWTPERPELLYEVGFAMKGRGEGRMRKRFETHRLKIHSGPGDEGEHVLTIMLPEED